MRRPQFSLKTALVLILAVACFFGGIDFERERLRREAARNGSSPGVSVVNIDGDLDGDVDVLFVSGPGQFSLMRRPLFSLGAMLWLAIIVAAAFVGGMVVERRLARARKQPVQAGGVSEAADKTQ